MKTATYLRQSLDRDLTKVSIDYQREGLLKLCADKRWDDPVEETSAPPRAAGMPTKTSARTSATASSAGWRARR
jgi:DNA invertase Pin-like site-specific DNA recombinase